MIPATAAALTDRRLRRSDLLVYGEAAKELDVAELRELKLTVLARRCGMHYANVARALRRLESCGYLARDPQRSPRWYRLHYAAPAA